MTRRIPSCALLVASVALTFGAACASTNREVRVETESTSIATVPHVKTYAFGSDEAAPARFHMSAASAEATHHMRSMIEADLRDKGFVPATSIASADLVWMFAAGRRDRDFRVHDSPHGDGAQDDDPDEDYVEGAVVIDALDGTTGKRVWHGFARTEIDPTKVDDALLRKAVDKVMSRFPATNKP